MLGVNQMATIEGEQNIPSEVYDLYFGALREGTTGSRGVWRRYPWKMPAMRKAGSGVSAKQLAQREFFIQAKDCYNCQPYTGGITPPGWGPRNRSWWFADAVGSGLWYYDYFMQQTMNTLIAGNTAYWCKSALTSFQKTKSGTPTGVYRTEVVVEFTSSLTSGSILWGQREQSYFPVLHVWYGGASQSDGQHDRPFTIHVYEALGTWDKTTLCWNNQPSIGASLGSYTYSQTPNPRDLAIPIPDGVLNFCMICSGALIDFVWFRRKPSGVHDGYYYMGI